MLFWGKPKTLGEQGERVAVKALRREGYSILARNAHFGRYEVDIIAREGDTLVFVEVKTRREEDTAAPEDNITPTKQEHLRRAARLYLSRERHDLPYVRFDVVSVVLPERGTPEVTLFRDAFQERTPHRY